MINEIILAKINHNFKELIVNFIPLILIFIIFYFFVYKIHKNKVNVHQNMISKLKIGDKVIINNGIIGSIVGFDKNYNLLILKIDTNVNIYVKRTSVTDIIKY